MNPYADIYQHPDDIADAKELMMEAYEEEARFRALPICPDCNGTGADPNDEPWECIPCDGKGRREATK